MAGTVEERLGRIPMYRRLAGADRSKLAEVTRSTTFERGAVVFHEGDSSHTLVLLASGRIKIAKTSPGGREVILDVLGSGDPVGAVAVFEGIAYPATATAMVESICLLTPREAFLGLLERYPSLVRGLLSGLSLRLVELTARLADLSGARVEARMARTIGRLAEGQSERRSDGLFVPVRLSRQELADLCGTTIETAIRIMSRWGKEGLVRTENDGFLVLDEEQLQELALG